jgi:hypothetical protein
VNRNHGKNNKYFEQCLTDKTKSHKLLSLAVKTNRNQTFINVKQFEVHLIED